MRAPKKVIAAMAMATLIGGVAAPAFADGNKFTINSGSSITGENASQKAEEQQSTEGEVNPAILSAEGDIRINGTFSKSVSSFPVPSKDGRYLRITMPLALDYTYNLDNNEFNSGKGQIINGSVHATNTASKGKEILEKQEVKMSFVGLNDITANDNVKYVDTINTGDTDNKAQLPFELVITRNGEKVGNFSFKAIQNAERTPIKPIIIGKDATLDLKIEQIGSQRVFNPNNAIKDGISKVGHNMTLRFEYNGK